MGNVYKVRVEHDPYEANHQHCEVRAFNSDDPKSPLPKVSSKIKKEFREAIVAKARVIKPGQLTSERWNGLKEDRRKVGDELEKVALGHLNEK